MSSQKKNYSLVTLNDRVVPGFAGIMRESVREKNSLSDRELKVVVASSSHVSGDRAIKFAKEVTKHIRIIRGWSFVSASVQPMDEQLATSRSTSADRTSFYCLDRGVAKEVIPTADDKCWLPFKASAIVPLSKKGVGPRFES